MPDKTANTPRATLFDVCRRTGLSTATVSRVLNNNPHVSPDTRQRVVRAMEKLGYVPNHAARSLAGQRQAMIGVVFPEISTGFWSEILRGLDAAAAERGYHLLTAFSHGGHDERDLVTRLLRERRIDALIVMNLRLDRELDQEAARANTPLILIDRPIAGMNLSSITIDNVAGAYDAMSHLHRHGYREIALLTGDADTFDSRQRLEGCRRAANDLRMIWDEGLIWPGRFTEESGRELIEAHLAAGRKPPRALFCFNDNLAIGAMEALLAHGYRVPEDVAVVGFDDVTPARHLGLTTIRVPLYEIGRTAAETAVHAIHNNADHSDKILSTELVVRRSCGCHADRPSLVV